MVARLLLGVVVVALLATVALFLGARYEPISVDPVDAAGDALVERGRYLATAGNCAACHTADDGAMAGGVPFETPFGTVYSTNISPDEATGIGAWSAGDFLNSMRFGVRPDGAHLYPVFPYTSFTKITDRDSLAIFAFLKTLPPVRQANRENELRFPFNQRWLLAAWKSLFFTPGALETSDDQTQQWNRGAYLVEALAHCGECHSPRNAFGAVKEGEYLAGGRYMDKVPGGQYRPWAAPNLSSHEQGLGLWSAAELVTYLQTGRNQFVDTFGPMNDVILHSTRHLESEDLAAMAVYFESVPAIAPAGGSGVAQRTLGRGRTIYNLHCGTCHLPTGLGDAEMAPRLAGGSLVARASDPASLINVILYGPENAGSALPMKWREHMTEFQYLLDDEEVAALASFVRHSWENGAGEVTAKQVAEQR